MSTTTTTSTFELRSCFDASSADGTYCHLTDWEGSAKMFSFTRAHYMHLMVLRDVSLSNLPR
jgi:hypothetical protein